MGSKSNHPAMMYAKGGRLMALLTLVALLGVGCTSTKQAHFGSTFETSASEKQIQSENETDLLNANNRDEQAAESRSSLLKPLGFEAKVTASSSSDVLHLSDEETIAVAFDKLSLEEFVNHALANILEVNFIIDPQAPLKDKKVTLSLKEKVSQKRFLSLFKEVLDQNQLALKIKNDVVFISGNKRRHGLPEYDYGYGRDRASVPVGSQPILQVVPIDFIDPRSLATFLIKLSNASPEQLGDPNLIGVRGSRHDVLRALDIVDMLDVPNVRGKHIMFVKLEYLPSTQFIAQVSELLENEGINTENALRFTDLARQNGIVVHSNNGKLLERVSYWQKQLDTPEATDDKQYFMYYPENMEAVKLAEVLQKLMSVSRGGAGYSNSAGQSALSTASANTNNSAAGSSSRASVNNSAQNNSGAGAGDDFSYVTDENRNVIIVYATASKFKSILPLLKKLDVTPPQVLIEAKLIEITLTDQHNQGIEWSLFGGDRKRDINASQLASFSGGSFSYTISGVDYNAVLNLLDSQDRLKVLSSPRIVVANGESASMNVGTEIPVLSTQSTDVDSDRVLQSIQYRSTGVDLTVQPTVNSSNVISMQVSQNVSETSENSSSGLDSPLILNRSFQTSVIARSGQSLVLGGLIRENNSSTDSQIPLLGDVPVLGKLFANESKSKSRTELLVLITPRIISNSSDIDDIKRLFVNELTLFE